MPAELVVARPDRLQQLRTTTDGIADGLALRAGALGRAGTAYRSGTDVGYQVDVLEAPAAVEAWATTARQLGRWVGEVGDAFEQLPGLGAARFGSLDRLDALLPGGLRLAGVDATSGLTVRSLASGGARADDVRAVASVLAAQATDGDGPDAPRAGRLAAFVRFLDIGMAARAGWDEATHRWSLEDDRPAAERVGRAALDGALTAGGTFLGGGLGAAAGTVACKPMGAAVQAVCTTAGSRVGTEVGGWVAEAVSDAILGDERPSWERSAGEVADLVSAGSDDLSAAVAGELDRAAQIRLGAAERHADFVLERPWLWDERYDDAPSRAAPPPPPAPPAQHLGPR